jgi:O-acetylserine/cysteine efflux transporter
MDVNRHDIGIGIIVVILWGLNFIAIKLGVGHVPPLMLASVRFLFVSIPAIFFLPRPPVPWGGLIALSMTIYVGQFAFLFLGIKLGMPAGLASLIHQSQAFFTLLVAVIFIKERLHWNHLAGLFIAATGMVIIGYQQNTGMTAIGFWFILIAAASWGVGNVIMRKVTQGVPPFSMISLVAWCGLVSFFPMVILSFIFEGLSSWQEAIRTVNWISAASVFYLVYFSSLAGYGLWGKLLARYPATIVAPFALLVPIIGMSSAAIFLREGFTFWQVVGSILVMAGLVVNVFGEKITKTKNLTSQVVLP